MYHQGKPVLLNTATLWKYKIEFVVNLGINYSKMAFFLLFSFDYKVHVYFFLQIRSTSKILENSSFFFQLIKFFLNIEN